MRKLRVCIYGGTDLKGMPVEFISELAYQILKGMDAVIVTGGFLHSKENLHATSTDSAALSGARKYSVEAKRDLEECYEAWIPEPSLDRRPDVKGVVRMTDDLGIKVVPMKGRTALGRRLAMVAGVDIVATISGRQHTEVVAEQALEIGVPVFPIPNAGGDSGDLLKTYRGRIGRRFAPGALESCLARLDETIETDPAEAAAAVVKLLRTAKVGRCLVLLPYDDEHDGIYRSTVEPAVSKHMFPLRLDEIPKSEAIYTSFDEAIDDSIAVIADVTALNKNVMYELGYAHGRKLTPFLYARKPSRLKNLPVYLQSRNVCFAPLDKLGQQIEKYLLQVKASRRLTDPGAV